MRKSQGCNGIEVSASVELVALPALRELAEEWRDLEQRSEGSFFVGWSWIGCWLKLLGDAADLRLIRARVHGRTVGLGVLTLYVQRRNGLIVSRTLRLHATGRPQFDVLAVECNGFLLERGFEELLCLRMLDHLFEAEAAWDELVLDGLWGKPVWPLPAEKVRMRVKPYANHYVSLVAVREKEGGYLNLLGAKTRSRIRRSYKEYEKFGPIGVRAAVDSKQAVAFLDDLKTLHQKYWIDRGEPGAFASPFFDLFHHQLIEDAFARGEIQLLAIDAGTRRLGYIYNFLYRGRVYNYQLGLDYDLCEKHNRPGLVAHTCAIQLNANAGHAIYDFLAGDAEYKQSLGTDVATMSWVVIQRDRLRFRVESLARGIRNRVRRGREGSTENTGASGDTA